MKKTNSTYVFALFFFFTVMSIVFCKKKSLSLEKTKNGATDVWNIEDIPIEIANATHSGENGVQVLESLEFLPDGDIVHYSFAASSTKQPVVPVVKWQAGTGNNSVVRLQMEQENGTLGLYTREAKVFSIESSDPATSAPGEYSISYDYNAECFIITDIDGKTVTRLNNYCSVIEV